MVNFFDILKSVCVLAHEELPASFSSSVSPYPEIKQYINDILEEICSKFYWTFREREYSFNTVFGLKEYTLPAGITAANILEKGVRVAQVSAPLSFIFHSELDRVSSTSGKPFRYSVFADKLILDPVPDAVYSMTVKYLTVNFAYNSDKTAEKSKLELETDLTIVPDRFIKALEWGAYSLYRQNYKPDSKYKLARDKYIEFLFDMQKNDGYSGDSAPSIVIGENQVYRRESGF